MTPKEGNVKPCVIFDVDGTLCDVRSVRYHVNPDHPDFSGRKRFDRFHADSIDCPPNEGVLELAKIIDHAAIDVVVVTARMYQWRYHTILWLNEHEVPYDELFMRADGDSRRDVEVKRDILTRIRRRWKPVLAVDDNPAVIELWESEGIPTLVVPGWVD